MCFQVPYILDDALPNHLPKHYRLLRLVRVLSFFRITANPVQMFSRVLARKSVELMVLFSTCAAYILCSALVIFFLENGAQPKAFSSVPQALWWSVETVTSLGYGDIVPITTLGKAAASLVAVLGVFIFSLLSGVLTAGFIELELDRREQSSSLVNPARRRGSSFDMRDLPRRPSSRDYGSCDSNSRDALQVTVDLLVRDSAQQRDTLKRHGEVLERIHALLQQQARAGAEAGAGTSTGTGTGAGAGGGC